VRFHQANDHIDTLTLQLTRSRQHGVRFANARRCTKENLQTAMAVFLHDIEQGIGACITGRFGHGQP
jgi:hypothetical protein